MIQAIGAIGSSNFQNDKEYKLIISELTQLGIKPTGKKPIDKARLEEEKEKLMQMLKTQSEKRPADDNKNTQIARLEEERPGAVTLAELNKYLHGIK